jgi:IPT/TIG domain
MKLNLSILLFLIILISCKKDEEMILPQVTTGNASVVTASSAVLNGNITLLGTETSTDHGFIWSASSGVSETNGTLISLGSAVKTGMFESNLSGLSRGKKYYYAAFVTVGNKKIFGNEQSFTTGAHSISSITPASVKAGERITIKGTDFVTNPSSIIVNVGNTVATIVSATETQIEADIPTNISGGSKAVRVTIENIDVTASSQVTVVPFIESISASWGFVNDILEIKGSGFGSASEVAVKFNDKTAVVNSSDYNKITLVVPTNSSGINVVNVITNSTPTSNPVNFNILEWKKLTDLPIDPRYAASAFVVNDFLYVGLGGALSGSRFDDFWKVNLKTGASTQMKNFPQGARFATNFFALGQKGYIVLGFDDLNAKSAELWEYEPSNDQWTQKSSFPGSLRTEAVSFVLNGKAYVGTGNGTTSLDDFYVYDPALNQWSPSVTFGGGPFYGMGSFVVGSKAYLACGVKNGDTIVNEVWEFDGTIWVKRANYPGILITDGFGFNYSDVGCFGFGWVNANTAGNENWIYYPSSNNWRKVENFPGQSRFAAISGSSSKYWFYGLGYKGNTEYKDIWIIELP